MIYHFLKKTDDMAPGLTSDLHDHDGQPSVDSGSVYQYSKSYLRKSRPLRIIVIGCGVSGIAAVKMFKDRFKGHPVELVIYEKNSNVGGTWFENRYPG